MNGGSPSGACTLHGCTRSTEPAVSPSLLRGLPRPWGDDRARSGSFGSVSERGVFCAVCIVSSLLMTCPSPPPRQRNTRRLGHFYESSSCRRRFARVSDVIEPLPDRLGDGNTLRFCGPFNALFGLGGDVKSEKTILCRIVGSGTVLRHCALKVDPKSKTGHIVEIHRRLLPSVVFAVWSEGRSACIPVPTEMQLAGRPLLRQYPI